MTSPKHRCFVRRTAWTLLLIWPLFGLLLALPPICHIPVSQASSYQAALHGTESHSYKANINTTALTHDSSGEACFDLRDLDLGISDASDPENKSYDLPLHVTVTNFPALQEAHALSMCASLSLFSALQLSFYQRCSRRLI